MGDKTGISWTQATWNPTTGCDKVSPGCGMPRFDGDDIGGCYAMAMAKRLKGMGSAKYQTDGDPGTSGPGFGVAVHPSTLDQPLRWTKPRRIFVNSMSDLFHKDIPDEFIAQVFAVMALARQHTFQLLTKRHARMRSLLSNPTFGDSMLDYLCDLPGGMQACDAQRVPWPLPNVWLGVSVESQQWADIRIPALLDTPAAVRWLSCEPLLGPVDVGLVESVDRCNCAGGSAESGYAHERHCGLEPGASWNRLHWVVAGGESGPNARPMHPDWARSLRGQCQVVGVPYHFKQWGAWGPLAPLDSNGVFDFSGAHAVADDGTVYAPGDLAYPDGPRYGEAIRARHDHAHLTNMYRLGKHHTGRELDGRIWDEYPQTVTS